MGNFTDDSAARIACANLSVSQEETVESVLNQNNMSYNREYTPERITSLQENEIFVFGSNIHGRHGAGAASYAYENFGAEWGVGEGLTGQCYALPTMEGGIGYVAGKVNNFIECARNHPELKFYVTPVGCGIAGFKTSQIGPLFAGAIELENVILPEAFVKAITE